MLKLKVRGQQKNIVNNVKTESERSTKEYSE